MIAAAVLAVSIGTVFLPENSKLTIAEFARLQPGVVTESYGDQTSFETHDTDVVVIFIMKRAQIPARLQKVGALAAAEYEKRRIFVLIPAMESVLGMNRTDPRFRIALGRVLAHELEHVKRGVPGHDEEGWFRSCVDRRWLTELGAVSR